jgi:hypothetical protein
LIYSDAPATRQLLAIKDIAVVARRPSSAIDWADGGNKSWQLTCEKLGSRAERRRRAFKKFGLTAAAISESRTAAQFVSHVETFSWKAAYGQDMHSRGQFALYSTLLQDGLLHAVGVTDHGRPVAYRLDARAGDTLFCVKWSYVDAYGKASPGFYLIARDLVERYHKAGIACIDLFGGADTLKEAVMTELRERVDVVWPASPLAEMLLRRSLEFDALVDSHYSTGRGLRYLYSRK